MRENSQTKRTLNLPDPPSTGRKKPIGLGIASGLIASLCCIGPLFIVLMGFASLPFALSLSQYSPFFLGLSAAFMVSAILIHLKRKSKACKINLFTKEGLRREKYFIATAIIVMLTVYGLSVYVITPTFAPIVYGMFSPAASPTSTSGEVNPRGLHQLSLKIGGMYCPSCGYVIWYTLNQKDGVIEVKISLSKEEGTVIYDPAEISGEEIVHVIESLGYNAKILADKPIED